MSTTTRDPGQTAPPPVLTDEQCARVAALLTLATTQPTAPAPSAEVTA